MKPASWLRRFVYLLLLLLWLGVISLPLFSVLLAARGELQLGDDPRRHLRLFLIQERDTQGIGIEWARPLREEAACYRTRLTYLMWEGRGENVSFCQCLDEPGGAPLPAPPDLCPAS